MSKFFEYLMLVIACSFVIVCGIVYSSEIITVLGILGAVYVDTVFILTS